MISARRFSRHLTQTVFALWACAAVFAANDRKFTTSTSLSAEATTLVKLLQEAHYNRDAVKPSDYIQVIPDFMSDLDGQHLFFLGSDKELFMKSYGKAVYYNTAILGKIEEAYEIFNTYQNRVEARVKWVFDQLQKEIDLNEPGSYPADRTKAEWPADAAASDELWGKRLRFELVGEILNKKTPEEAKVNVRKRYERMIKNVGEIEGNDLAELYLSTIAKLYDPHSTYFSPTTFEDFAIQMKLQLVGIGALLGLEDDVCTIKEIVPGGPADLGRELKPNDKIISVGQTGAEPVEIIGMKLRKIVDMIRGAKGTKVHLMVQPANAADSSARKEIIISRDVVKLNSARARAAIFQVPGLEGKTYPLGVITLPAFYGPSDDGDTDAEKTTASRDVARLIDQLQKKGIEGLVLDLRRNGGGYLTEAIDLAGLFINKGPIVQVKRYDGAVQVDEDSNPKIAYAGPMAVLVDRFSASASEIVAGALQNYGRAIVVGDSSTHGKGSVQQVVEMRQLSPNLAYSPAKSGAAKFTIQKYYLPSGASTQLKGVIPDIVLPSELDSLPIGEADLPHALVWDQIKTSVFNGAPLEAKVLTPLRATSTERQANLEEFTYLRRNVDRFKARQEQKLISVNLEERRKQKEDDDAFRKAMKAEKERLAKNDFPFEEFRLGPPAPPKIKAVKKAGDEDADEDIGEENDTYVKADVHLRETLRVVGDAIALGKNQQVSASSRPPLTASVSTGG